MNTLDPDDVERLASDSAWLRALALRLARDGDEADELVQRTWIRYVLRAPATVTRAWLATVLRNVWREDRRRDQRRAHHESLAIPRASDVAADVALERLEMQRSLMLAVLALDEPYRSVVVERYYEGRSPEEIAELRCVPVKTVRTRLARALQKLRSQLDNEHGGRERWLSTWLVLFSLPRYTHRSWPLMRAASAIVVFVGGIVWLSMVLTAQEARSLNSVVPAKVVAEPSAILNSPAPEFTPRAAIEASAGQLAPTASRPHVRGQVVDASGKPIGGAKLVFVEGEYPEWTFASDIERGAPIELGASAADGTFDFEARSNAGLLRVSQAGWTTLFAANVWADDAIADALVVVARTAPLVGRVVDAEQHPIVGAKIVVRTKRAVRNRLRRVLDGCTDTSWTTRSDADGRFEIADAPLVEAASLRAQFPGCMSVEIALPVDRKTPCELMLNREPSALVVRGTVVDSDGKPAAGAWVSQGHTIAHADDSGHFVLESAIDRDMWDSITADCRTNPVFPEIIALKPGLLPALAREPSSEDHEPFVIRLGSEARAIAGRIVDGEDHPLEGVRVTTCDLHRFGYQHSRALTSGTSSIESVIGRTNSASQPAPFAITDRDGKFVLRGLTDAPYRLVAFDPRTLANITTPQVDAGATDVRVVMSSTDPMQRVAGRVVDSHGKPIAGARVFPRRPVPMWRYGNGETELRPQAGAFATTDAQGRFEFAAIATKDLTIQVSSRSIGHAEFAAEGSVEDLSFVVPTRRYIQVDLHERPDLRAPMDKPDSAEMPEAATWFVVRDAKGQAIEFFPATDNKGAPLEFAHAIDDDLSEVILVPESAAEVRIQKHDAATHTSKDVARAPITFGSGSVTSVIVR